MIFNTCKEASAEWELEANICLSEEKVGFKMDVLVGELSLGRKGLLYKHF